MRLVFSVTLTGEPVTSGLQPKESDAGIRVHHQIDTHLVDILPVMFPWVGDLIFFTPVPGALF